MTPTQTISKAQQNVTDFMAKAGQHLPEAPQLPTKDVYALRCRLIQEELDELYTAYQAYNMVEVADAIADLLYVVLGAACASGIDIEPIFDEVHRSNMSKFIDGHRREDGKWVKGPSYTPANIKPLLEAQCS